MRQAEGASACGIGGVLETFLQERACGLDFWVPEGQSGGFLFRHEIALELVSGDVKTILFQRFSSLTRLRGSLVSILAEKPRKTDPTISSQTAFRYPGF